MKKLLLLLAVLTVWALVPATANADDGAISFGGLPRLLSGHPSITMTSEVVRMTVGARRVTVDCLFEFKNNGPACTVRMGFPDQGDGDESDPTDPKVKPKGTFLTYTSYVDGVRVPTTVLRGSSVDHFWHAKTVWFAANAVRSVHDIYTTYLGDQVAASGSAAYNQTYYVLHTGSSWAGPIGSAKVVVTFEPGTVALPIRLMPLAQVPQNNPAVWSWTGTTAATVVYRGPCTPSVAGRKLVFVRTGFKPQYLDDILLYFDYKTMAKQ